MKLAPSIEQDADYSQQRSDMGMLERLKQLEAAGAWAEIVQLAPVLPAGLAGDDLARAYLSVSTAYFNVAAGPEDFHRSLRFAHHGLRTATSGSLNHTWALGKIACLLADTGRTTAVGSFATAYKNQVSRHPGLSALTPYVEGAMALAAYNRGDFLTAATYYRHALSLFHGNTAQKARTEINLVWCYSRAGRPGEARSYLPASVPAHMLHLRYGAEAALLAAEGDWNGAEQAGRAALRGNRTAHDYADAAEVCLILAQAAQRQGATANALAFIAEAASFAARQDYDVLTLLVLSLRAEGGDLLYATAASCGSGGWYPDSCFTTGVA